MEALGRYALGAAAIGIYSIATLFFFALAHRVFDMALVLSGSRRGVQTVLAAVGIASTIVGGGLVALAFSVLFLHLSGFPS